MRGKPRHDFLGNAVAMAAVGGNGAGGSAARPADGEDILARRQRGAAIADAGDDEIDIEPADGELDRAGVERKRRGMKTKWSVIGLPPGSFREAAQDLEVLGLAQPLRRRIAGRRLHFERGAIGDCHGAASRPISASSLLVKEACSGPRRPIT